MNDKRFNLIMSGVTALFGIGILGALFGASSLLKQQSNKLYELKLKDQVLDRQQLSLVKAKKDIEKYAELQREAKVIVPQDKDQAAAVREIVKIANSSKINISSIIFPVSTLGNTTKSTGSTTSNTGSSSATSSKTSPITQTQPVPGLKGVYTLPITIQVTETAVSYSDFINFLSKLEQNRRTAQVSGINIQPVVGNPGQVNFTLIVNAYIKP